MTTASVLYPQPWRRVRQNLAEGNRKYPSTNHITRAPRKDKDESNEPDGIRSGASKEDHSNSPKESSIKNKPLNEC